MAETGTGSGRTAPSTQPEGFANQDSWMKGTKRGGRLPTLNKRQPEFLLHDCWPCKTVSWPLV